MIFAIIAVAEEEEEEKERRKKGLKWCGESKGKAE
jgi:hypothetical protein